MKSPLLPSSKSSARRLGLVRGFFYACLIGVIILVSLWAYRLSGPSTSSQNTATPMPPTPASNAARLVQPTLIAPSKPTQLDQGALIYWGVCMACHGDRGQGLTDEWRAVYNEDSNCWASKCHASNHPPQGFVIPRTPGIPAVAGPAALARFSTTQELYEYILVSMPWWKPNSLTPEKAWAVTAYTLKLNGTLPQGIVLDATNASAIPVHHLVTASQNDQTVELVLAAILVLIAVVMVTQVTIIRKAALTPSTGVTSDSVPVPARRWSNFFHHLHPLTIPAQQARWRYTLGAGGLAVFLFLVLLVTGILEMFYYVPQADQATISIQTIAHLVPFGGLIRNLHFWGAQALVAVLCVHLLRIVMTGAYKKPRRFNYLLGLSMLILVIALDFTGYILRWDEGTSWALVVGTNLIKTIPLIGNQLYEFVIGGEQPGSSTVLRFYSWHTFGLTLAMIIAVVWHIFRIRRDGGIAVFPPSHRQGEEYISRFELVRREMLIMTVAGIALLLLSIFWPAPITPPLVNTTVDLSSARAPWFFLWVQQLLKLGDPFLLGVMVPLIILSILILIPYIFPRPSDAELGRWFPKGGRVAQILITVLALLILALTIWAILPTT